MEGSNLRRAEKVSVIALVEPKPTREIDVEIPADLVAEFESGYVTCLDQSKLLVIKGSEEQRERYLKLSRIWASEREERLTVRLYNHPRPDPDSTYYRIIPFVGSRKI